MSSRRMSRDWGIAVFVLLGVPALCSACDASPMVRMSDGTYQINTTTLCDSIEGYIGPTPLMVYIKNGQIVKLEALPNEETPQFFQQASQGMFAQFKGMNVASKDVKPIATQVDVVTGATYSSMSILQNVATAVEYYRKHK